MFGEEWRIRVQSADRVYSGALVRSGQNVSI